jgi:hypothetical protein
MPGAFVYTEAPRREARPADSGERFPAGARLMLFSGSGARALLPGFAASADAAISFDGMRLLFAGKQRAGDPWQIWEMPLAGGVPRRVTTGKDDCLRPCYLPDDRIVYARRTPQGFQIESLALAGGAPFRVTYLPGNHLPDAVLRDGRVLYEAPHPASDSPVREIFTVYTDGTGVETYRCDHGPDRHSAAQLASGDIVFETGGRLAIFTSARAGQVNLPLPKGEFAGPVAEAAPGEWLASYRPSSAAAWAICRVRPGDTGEPTPVVKGNAFQPVMVQRRPVPQRHPSSLGDREGANVLCLNAYTSKGERIPPGIIATVQLWSRAADGAQVGLGTSAVEPDGSFYLQVPSERPLRFELLDRAGKVVKSEKGWFWMRKGEQRVCVGCHAGPERAPENVTPQVLLRTQTPTRLGLPPGQGGIK